MPSCDVTPRSRPIMAYHYWQLLDQVLYHNQCPEYFSNGWHQINSSKEGLVCVSVSASVLSILVELMVREHLVSNRAGTRWLLTLNRKCRFPSPQFLQLPTSMCSTNSQTRTQVLSTSDIQSTIPLWSFELAMSHTNATFEHLDTQVSWWSSLGFLWWDLSDKNPLVGLLFDESA